MKKEEITYKLNEVSDQFLLDCSLIPDEIFFRQPAEKWSIAQNVTHLTSAAGMTKLAYQLPKFMVRIYGGRSNRSSKTYDELVAKYKLKLAEGGKAGGRYIPRTVPAEKGKEKILFDFANTMKSLNNLIGKNWEDEQLDKYIAPHPLLGKITLRELGYFTIYHTLHHQNIIKERLKE